MSERLDPLAVASLALGAPVERGAKEAAARVLLALSEAGWRLVHCDEPHEALRYGRKQTTIEGEAR